MDKIYTEHLDFKQTHMVLKSDMPTAFPAARRAVLDNRGLLEGYIQGHPEFQTSLEPLELDASAPAFIRDMMRAGLEACVGPMAAVAGGLAEVASAAMMKQKCKLAIAENGGDIAVKGERSVTVGVYAGENRIGGRVGFKLSSNDMPIGICTSAGSVGHSISLGEADAVIIFASSAFLADAAATAVGNRVKKTDPEGAIQDALELAEDIEGVRGCMIFMGESVGTMGRIPELIEVLDQE